MKVYTYSEARQNLASVLDQAGREGEVRIKRRDGQVFVVRLEPRTASPLDVDTVELGLSAAEMVEIVRAGRARDRTAPAEGDAPSHHKAD
jgi:PHD/YefM family antitoxin component YafN of YafNO toxin-antitoxin module